MAQYRERLRRSVLAPLLEHLGNGSLRLARRYSMPPALPDAAASAEGATRVGRLPDGTEFEIPTVQLEDLGRVRAMVAGDSRHGRTHLAPSAEVERGADGSLHRARAHAADHGTQAERDNWSVGKYREHLAAFHGLGNLDGLDPVDAHDVVALRRWHMMLHGQHARVAQQDTRVSKTFPTVGVQLATDMHHTAHTWDGGQLAWGPNRLREHLEDWHGRPVNEPLRTEDIVAELRTEHARLHALDDADRCDFCDRAAYHPVHHYEGESHHAFVPRSARTEASTAPDPVSQDAPDRAQRHGVSRYVKTWVPFPLGSVWADETHRNYYRVTGVGTGGQRYMANLTGNGPDLNMRLHQLGEWTEENPDDWKDD